MLNAGKASAAGLGTKLISPATPSGGTLQHPSRLMPPPSSTVFSRFATPRPNSTATTLNNNPGSSATSRFAFPMATPLTNPGLATPSANRFMPSSPPLEYRPPSPGGGGIGAPAGYQMYVMPTSSMALEASPPRESAGYSLSSSRLDLKRYAAPMEPHSPPPPSSPT